MLFHDDCMHVLPHLGEGSVDLILCDLPYGATANKWDQVIPIDPLWKQYRRLLRPKGNIVLFSQGIFTAKLIVSAEDLFRYKMAWVKNRPSGPLNAKRMPMRSHEDVCVFGEKSAKYNQVLSPGYPYKVTASSQHSSNYGKFASTDIDNQGTRVPTDVLKFDIVFRKGRHPTEKPIDLCRYLVKLFSDPGDLVLDNTMGSGTIPLAAKLESRRYIGIEKDDKWYEVAQSRILQNGQSQTGLPI